MLSSTGVATHRKPCGGSTRNQRSPGLCHGPAQEEIAQGSQMQRCFNREYTSEFNSQNPRLSHNNYFIFTCETEGRQAADNKGLLKHRGRSQQSPDKSSSRSPLRNTTQDRNVHTTNIVEFREPLASYRYKQNSVLVSIIIIFFIVIQT